jgi:hypothetical protein
MFLMPGSREKKRVIPPIAGAGIAVSRQSPGSRVAASLVSLTASTSANITVTAANTYTDGPTVAQGTAGTWLAGGNVVVNSGSVTADTIVIKLWDGTTVMDSNKFVLGTGGSANNASVFGIITNPAGNIRISVNDTTSSQGVILFNNSGSGKDSTVTAVRIA